MIKMTKKSKHEIRLEEFRKEQERKEKVTQRLFKGREDWYNRYSKITDPTRKPLAEEFIYFVRKCGGSSHIMLGKRWLGRTVKVRVEEVKE